MFDPETMIEEISNFLQSELGGEVRVTAQTDLLEAGVLDSLTMMDLLAFVESRYGVRFEDSEIAPRHFRTVDCFVRLVTHKLLGPLKTDCLLCREVDTFNTFDELNPPGLLVSDSTHPPFETTDGLGSPTDAS